MARIKENSFQPQEIEIPVNSIQPKGCPAWLAERVDELYLSNPFKSVRDVLSELDLLSKEGWDAWRLIEPAKLGEFNGIPSSSGLLVATNGIEAVIYGENASKRCFIGHLNNFVEYEKDEEKREWVKYKGEWIKIEDRDRLREEKRLAGRPKKAREVVDVSDILD